MEGRGGGRESGEWEGWLTGYERSNGEKKGRISEGILMKRNIRVSWRKAARR